MELDLLPLAKGRSKRRHDAIPSIIYFFAPTVLFLQVFAVSVQRVDSILPPGMLGAVA